MTVTRQKCEICGSPDGWSGTKICDGCWEVTRRLSGFLHNNPKAVQLVAQELADADPRFLCLKNMAVDEPIFILKAKDELAAILVETWSNMARSSGAPIDKYMHARDTALQMRKWGEKNGTKVPD